MNGKWRKYLPALEQYLFGNSDMYYRDPYTVVILNFKINQSKYIGVGVTKRNRYARTKDEPNTELAIKIATERAYKDFYNQAVSEHKSKFDLDLSSIALASAGKYAGRTAEHFSSSLGALRDALKPDAGQMNSNINVSIFDADVGMLGGAEAGLF